MATTDVISYERARQALSIGVTDTLRRDLLEAAITAVSQAIDDVAGPVVQRTVTEVIDVREPCVAICTSVGPVASITTVTSYVDGTGTVLTGETLSVAGGYLAELQQRVRADGTSQMLSGVLRRRSSFSDDLWDAPARVQVVFVAGRYASTTAAADSRFEQAAALTLRSMWRAYTNQIATPLSDEYALAQPSFPGFALPRAALELISADRFRVVGVA